MTAWDYRQLVAARGALARARVQADLAIEILDTSPVDSELRARAAFQMAAEAMRDLGRYTRRQQHAREGGGE